MLTSHRYRGTVDNVLLLPRFVWCQDKQTVLSCCACALKVNRKWLKFMPVKSTIYNVC
jgi:hypothetical protein